MAIEPEAVKLEEAYSNDPAIIRLTGLIRSHLDSEKKRSEELRQKIVDAHAKIKELTRERGRLRQLIGSYRAGIRTMQKHMRVDRNPIHMLERRIRLRKAQVYRREEGALLREATDEFRKIHKRVVP